MVSRYLLGLMVLLTLSLGVAWGQDDDDDDGPIGGAPVGGDAVGYGDGAIGGAPVGGGAVQDDGDQPIGGDPLQ